MQTRLMILFAVAAAISGASAADLSPIERSSDIRYIGAKSVDLGPLHQWYADPKGERPLKHWRKLQVVKLKVNFGSWQQCALKTESGTQVELLIAHMPVGIKPYLETLSQQEVAIAALRAEVSTELAKVRRADAVTPVAVGGDPYLVSQTATQRARVNLDAVVLTEKKERLADLIKQHEEWMKQSAERLSFFAMPNGSQHANQAVWDCGTDYPH